MSDEAEKLGLLKFDTCKYRSEDQEEVGEFSCCTNTLHLAYVCFRRNIEDLTHGHCVNCKQFKEKVLVNE